MRGAFSRRYEHLDLGIPRDWRDASISIRAMIDELKLWDFKPKRKLNLELIESLEASLCKVGKGVRDLSEGFGQLAQSLEDLHEGLEDKNLQKKYLLGNIDFLVDASHLLSNTYNTWGRDHFSYVETPIRNFCNELKAQNNGHNDNKLRKVLGFVPMFKIPYKSDNKPIRSLSQEDVQTTGRPIIQKKPRKNRLRHNSAVAIPSLKDENYEDIIIQRSDMMLNVLSEAATSIVNNCESSYVGLKKYGAYSENTKSCNNIVFDLPPRKKNKRPTSQRKYLKKPKTKNTRSNNPTMKKSSNFHSSMMDLAYVLDYDGESHSI